MVIPTFFYVVDFHLVRVTDSFFGSPFDRAVIVPQNNKKRQRIFCTAVTNQSFVI
jgi:hypothetical protein